MRHGLCVAAGIVTILGAREAPAEDATDLESLLSENVITTASTEAQVASTAPATSVTITAEELRIYGFRSLDEAINYLSLGVITAAPLRTPDIGARGVLLPRDDGKHVLLLVNGHAINDPLFGAARFDQGMGIPLDMVDHVEVIVGPGSVLYGSSAMLGVINVITKSGSAHRGVHALAEYEIERSVRGGASAGTTFELFGADSELTTGVEYYQRFGPDLVMDEYRLTFGGIRFRRGGPADGVWGGAVRDAYFTEAPSGMARLRVGDFVVGVTANAYRRGIAYSSPGVDVDFDDPDSTELDRSLRFDVQHGAVLSSLLALDSRVYADYFDYQRRLNRDAEAACFRTDIETCQYYDAGIARWAGVEERVSFNWLTDTTFVTLLGIDARMRWVQTNEDALDFETGDAFAPTAGLIDDTAVVVSPYLQQTWSPTGWLDVNVGARLDADERFSPILSPRGAIAWAPYHTTVIKGIYSQAFRAPTWSETDLGDYHRAPSDLEPEKVRSVEGSVEQRFGTHRVLFGVFRTWWENLVESRPLSVAELGDLQARGVVPLTATDLVRFDNVSSIENYGWNGAWSGTFAETRLSYGLNGTAAYTRRGGTAVAAPLAAAPQLFGNLHAAYRFGGYLPTPALAVRYIGDRLTDREPETGPEYAAPRVELRATLSGTVPVVRGLGYRLSAAVASATDSPYVAGPAPRVPADAIAASRVPVDPFNVFLGLRYDFGTGDPAEGEAL